MDVSAEFYFAANFLMDTIIFTASAKGVRHARMPRIFAAALAGTLYAFLAGTHGFRILRTPLSALSAALVLDLIAFGWNGCTGSILGALRVFACAVFMAGMQYLLVRRMTGWFTVAVGTVLGYLLVGWLLETRAKRISQIELDLVFRIGNRQTAVKAVVDTGNRLHEPVSALPVLIVSSMCLPPHFCAGLNPRHVYYGVLGSSGVLDCYRPDRIWTVLDGHAHIAPDVWIAIYPGTIPGGVQALAPACMAEESVFKD